MPTLQVQQDLEAQLAKVKAPLRTKWKGRYCYVSVRFLLFWQSRICRFEYLSGTEEWRCAIYRPSRDVYGSDGMFFPAVGDPVELTEMCLSAHGLG